MLAGERFSDHPGSVCRVIAAFLRCYNDAVGDERRRDLYRSAADVVGTRSSRATEGARLAVCERALAAATGRTRPRLIRRVVHALRLLDLGGNVTEVYRHLADALSVREDGHAIALALVDDLIATRVPLQPPCQIMTGAPAPWLSNPRLRRSRVPMN